MKSIKAALLGLAVAALASQASAAPTNLVVNGSFEANSLATPFFTYYKATQGLVGWKIDVQSVDLVGSLWNAASGSKSLDLNGNKKGVISQQINTVVGQTYQLSFDLAGNFQGGNVTKGLAVNVGTPGLYSFNTAGKSSTNMGWTSYNTSFVAVSSATTLVFASQNSGAYGAALDNISVTAVPEPETFAMLLAGLGMVGVIARRRKANNVA